MIAKTKTSEYLLIFRNTGWHKDLSPEEIQQNMARFTAWFERLSNEGRFKSGGPLLHDGKILASKNVVTDGPFAESKESLAGYWVVDVDSEARAIELAARVVAFIGPAGAPPIELRQIGDARPLM